MFAGARPRRLGKTPFGEATPRADFILHARGRTTKPCQSGLPPQRLPSPTQADSNRSSTHMAAKPIARWGIV
jgi:hypothetical protein